MRARLLIALILAGVAGLAVGASSASTGSHKPHKHRTVSSTKNNLPPGFGSASGSSGEDVIDGTPPPDEPADDGDNSSSTAPSVTTPEAAPTATVPQVVTVPTITTSGAVTTSTTVTAPAPKPAPPPPPPPPLCLNHPDFPALPSADWYRVDGNCFVKQKADYGMCAGDQYQLVTIDNVDHMLATGYNMGIIVDTPDPAYRLNCLITDVATYRMNPGDFVFSGKYVQDGWPRDWQTFDNPVPYPWSGWKPLYPLWVQKSQIKQFTSVADQSLYSIQAYGLLWGANRYQTVASFTRRLKAQSHTWKGWKHNHPALAADFISHVSLLRR
jgi:hypothetical protein